MSRSNNKLILLLWLALLGCTFGEVRNHAMSYSYEEPLLMNARYPYGLKVDEDLSKLELTDPRLRLAYVYMIRGAYVTPSIYINKNDPLSVLALDDLRRRGDAATPLLLDIMNKNHNTSLEDLVPMVIHAIGTIQIEPYLDYLRQMVKTRTDEINGSAADATTKLFFDCGTQEDIKMMQDLAGKRSFLAPYVELAFEHERRKRPAIQRLEIPASAQAALSQAPQKTPETKPALATVSEEADSSTLWSVVGVLIVSLTGLLWLLLKKQKCPPLQ